MSRRPHQRGEVVAVAFLGVAAGGEEPCDDVVEAARGGIDHSRLAGSVARLGVRAMGEKVFGDAVVALESRGHEWRQAGAARKVWIGAFSQQKRDGRVFLCSAAAQQSGAAIDIAGVDRGAVREKKLDQPI